MRSALAYAVVAVLVMAASLGAVSLAWGDPGVTKSTKGGAANPEPFPVGGSGGKHAPQGKQTPLLMRVLDPPRPVKGTDGKYHLVYELVLTNSSPGTAKVESIQTMDAKSGEVVDSLAGAEVAARTVLLGDISGATAEEVGSGRVALVFLDAAFEDRRDVPKEIEHRVKTSFDIPPGFGSNLFPKQTTDVGGATGVSNKKPVVIGPPLRGKNWVADNGCCNVSPHRGAMVAVDQKLLAAERYAIDWFRSDDEGHIVFPDENTKLEDAGGNHVIVDIGGGKYAFYAHLKPNSITVQEGERVRRGQVLARLGNSGNTTAPHLHFHVMDAPLSLGAENNLPYVIDSFRYQGYIGDDLTPHLLENP